jgi:hypothetical protein
MWASHHTKLILCRKYRDYFRQWVWLGPGPDSVLMSLPKTCMEEDMAIKFVRNNIHSLNSIQEQEDKDWIQFQREM